MTLDIAKARALCEAYARLIEATSMIDYVNEGLQRTHQFANAARTLLPAALDEVERLRKVEAAARALIEEWKRRCTLNTNIDIDGVPVIPAPPYRQLLDLAIALQSADIPANLPRPVREAF